MIEIIAMLTMLIDHVGLVLMDNELIFRIIGRIAFPAFLVMLARGYSSTSDIAGYINRLILLGLISQLPYMVVFLTSALNICFTLVSILCAKIFIDKKEYKYIALIIIAFMVMHFDYGLYGLAFGVLALTDKRYALVSLPLALIIIITMIYSIKTGTYIQILSIPAYMIIKEISQIKIKFRIPRLIKYYYYPAHIMALAMVIMLIKK